MPTDRRDFLGTLAAGVALGAMPLSLDARRALAEPMPHHANRVAAPFDLTWVDRIKGKYRAVFDVPEVDSGYGVWRASIWERQYMEMLGAKPSDLSAVVVLRHKGIALAFQQAYWDAHSLGKVNDVKHPVSGEATTSNPVLLSSARNEVPKDLDDVALDRFMSRGGIVLACNLALDDIVEGAVKRDGGSADSVRQQAIAAFVPGVILQPSGVFGALHAQDAGCKYLRAS